MTAFISMWILTDISLSERMAGMFVLSVPLLILTCIKQGSIGGGDIKYLASGGFLLGAKGIWKAFETGIFFAGMYVLYLLICKNIKRKAEIPLGPFLSIGMIVVIMNM